MDKKEIEKYKIREYYMIPVEVIDNIFYLFEQQVKKQKEVIDKATNDLQQLIDDTKNKTVLSLGQFIPKLEIIQDELNGSNDILKGSD